MLVHHVEGCVLCLVSCDYCFPCRLQHCKKYSYCRSWCQFLCVHFFVFPMCVFVVSLLQSAAVFVLLCGKLQMACNVLNGMHNCTNSSFWLNCLHPVLQAKLCIMLRMLLHVQAYNKHCILNVDSTDARGTDLTLLPNETKIYSFRFVSQLEDVGKTLEVYHHSNLIIISTMLEVLAAIIIKTQQYCVYSRLVIVIKVLELLSLILIWLLWLMLELTHISAHCTDQQFILFLCVHVISGWVSEWVSESRLNVPLNIL